MTTLNLAIPEEFKNINSTIFSSSSSTLTQIFNNWPNYLAALGILLVGLIIKQLVQLLIKRIASKAFFKKISHKTGFTDFLNKAQIKSSPSHVIANFLGGYLFTMFFLAATKILGLNAISDFLDKVIKYIPNLVVALFIVLIGFKFAKTVSAIIESTLNILNSDAAQILSVASKGIMIVFAILAALFQLQIAEDLVKIVFTGVVAMISLAGGLSLGLGSKDLVKKMLTELKKENK